MEALINVYPEKWDHFCNIYFQRTQAPKQGALGCRAYTELACFLYSITR